MNAQTCNTELTHSAPASTSAWLTRAEVCRLLRAPAISATTLWRYVKQGRFPAPEYPFGPPPQPPLWRRSIVLAFIADPEGWRKANENPHE
jgi:hypothetical protein